VSWDAADLCWRWSGRTPTALAMPSSTRPLSTGSIRPPSPGGVLVRSSSGRLELRIPNGVSARSACEGSRRLWREPRALCVRDSPHLDGGSDRRLGPLPPPCQATRHRQPVSGSASPDPAHAVREGVTSLPASSSNESSDVQGSIDPAYPQSYLEVAFLLHRRSSRKGPRVDGSSKAVVAEPLTTADVTQAKDCGPHTKTPW